MTESVDNIYIIKPWLFDKGLNLIITPEFIEYKDTRINKADLCECRFGIRWLVGLEFTIGRDHQVFIKSKTEQIIKISFKTFYGINKNELWGKYTTILDKIWNYYFSEITNEYLEKFYSGQTILIAGVKISPDNVVIKSTAGFKEKEVAINWDDLGAKDYETYFALYSKADSANINCGFKYKDIWNAWVLQSFISTVLKQKTG
jgi:uncharacterized protein (DUF433 family)